MNCKQCSRPTNGTELCESCEKKVKEKAERLKAYLDGQNESGDIVIETEEKKNKLGCLVLAGILFPPIWLGMLIYHFRRPIMSFVSTLPKSTSSPSNPVENTKSNLFEENEQKAVKFGFVGGDGNYFESGGVFCDWAGNYVKWGESFIDSKGYRVEWGKPFYDGKGYYCEWGGPFYDCKGNYIVPK